MTSKQILLIRHGETDWNAQQRWQGQAHHVPLNVLGRTQAQALGQYLAQQRIDALYSSDLIRTWETASIVGEALKITPQADARWREIHVGLFQGHTRQELETRYPEHWATFNARKDDYCFPDGESWTQVGARAAAALSDLAKQDTFSSIAVVSHGGTLRCLMSETFPHLPEASQIRFTNTSITTLRANGAGWELINAAITPHLEDPTS